MTEVHVTQDDIDYGVERATSSCPVAKALQRTFGPSSWAGLNFIGAYGVIKMFSTPKVVRNFMLDFDDGRQVSFTLEML